MDPPSGFVESLNPREVCHLKKSLYGLKQSPRAWFGRFNLAMRKYSFKQSNSDHTLFLKRKGKLVTCLIIYVDDMIITGNDEEEMTRLRTNLFKEFKMKDLGRLKYFLGIEVLRSKQGIFIWQKKYVLDLLAETRMIDCKPVDTPMMLVDERTAEDDIEVFTTEPESTQTHGVEPVNLVTTELTRFTKTVRLTKNSIWRKRQSWLTSRSCEPIHASTLNFPHESHIENHQIPQRNPDHIVLFKANGHLETQVYTNADWAGDKGNRRSTSGYFILVGGNLVTWRSKKQKVVSLSSAEAEFRGIAQDLAEALWIQNLLSEIRYHSTQTSKNMCDNKAAIQISKNPVQHDRTKHIEVDRHFIKEKLENGIIELPFVRSKDQLTDILTKAVSGKNFMHYLSNLNIGNPTTQLEGEC
nr:putative RNA-directed DNA polymerase [Tanacetum cinerariifolium]